MQELSLVSSTGIYLKRGLIEASVSAQQANESVSRCVCAPTLTIMIQCLPL